MNRTKNKKVFILIFAIFILFVVVNVFFMFLHNKKELKKELFYAIEVNDIETVERIIGEKPDLVNEKRFFIRPIDTSNPTPLLTAIQFNQSDIVRLLVENGANVNKKTTSYPIINAIDRENYSIAEYLIENGADVTVVDETPWKRTVLFTLAATPIANGDVDKAKRCYELFKFAFEKNAPTEAHIASPGGIHSLCGIASMQNNYLIVEYLIVEKLYNINEYVTDSKKTSLICAVENKAYDACEILVHYGADKNIADDYGMTAYDYAVQLEDPELIRILS